MNGTFTPHGYDKAPHGDNMTLYGYDKKPYGDNMTLNGDDKRPATRTSGGK